ncbi:MAG: SprB repeat-containing protein, partial [Bacteroidetes bacterium]|nr:SprB repeat-containing protein [Bacteroidota bacterium]
NSCTYRIHHKSFYDCTGGAVTLPPGQTSIPSLSFNGLPSGCSVNPQLIGNWVFGYNIDITPVCPSLIGLNSCASSNHTVIGVAEAYWYADYDICNGGIPSGCTELEVSYYACCRNGAITSGAANDGIFVKMTVAIDSVACNNIPVFNQSPEAMICSGTSTIMDHSATDPDGDSLVYSLTPCYSNIGLPVGYSPGYSPQNFLGSTWITSMDPVTGMLSIIPNPIGSPVVGVICVTVDEYRNGVHIGSVNRDFQVVVVNCTNSTQVNSNGIQNIDGGTITAPNTIEVCAGLPVSFDLIAIDSDPMDSIFISSNLSALFGNSSEITNGTNPVTYSVSFTPGAQQIGSSYQLQVLIEDNQCPLNSSIIENITINIIGNCLTYQTTNSSCTANTGAIDITLLNATPPIQYLWSNGATTEDLTGIPSGIYWVTATDSTGQVYTDTIVVDGDDIVITDSLVQPSCDSSDGSIFVSASGAIAPYSYLWSNGATTQNITGLPAGGYTVYVTDAAG